MKLEKFKAASMAEAMTMIVKKFGPDAVIYFQNQVDNGVEVIAGHHSPSVKTPSKEPEKTSESLFERISSLDNESTRNEFLRIEKQQLLMKKLYQLKFPHDFIEQNATQWALGNSLEDIANDEALIKILFSRIKIEEEELIHKRRICALVGPTGIGKSTTVAKLARRFIAHYGVKKLGIISTDFQRILAKNQFHYFGKLLNIQVENAQNTVELREALHVLSDKQLVLIDTAGVNQNDNQKLAELFERLGTDGEPIITYLVLPCTLQSDILTDVVSRFKMHHTAGCIITKIDEGKSLAPCLSVIMNNYLPIAYWCNGQNIVSNIAVPNRVQIIETIFQGERRDAPVFV